MSNYYKSKCCGEQVDWSKSDNSWLCKRCELCCDVTAMLDTPGGVPKEDALISKQDVLDLITQEILVCHHENTPTSRLTSLFMEITKLK